MAEQLTRCPLEFGCNRPRNRRSFRLGKLCLHGGCCGQASQAGREGSYCSLSVVSNAGLRHEDGNCEGKADGFSQSSGYQGKTSEHRK